MTALDERLIPQILSIVKKYGKVVTITVPAEQSYSPTAGKTTQAGETNYQKKVTPPEQYSIKLIDGEQVKKGDMRVWLPASGLEFVPVANLKVSIDSESWTVIDVEKVYTGELVGLYGLQLRK